MPATNFRNPGANDGIVRADGFSGPNANVAGVATIATADATDLATAIALANATKARVNQLITALKAAS